MERTAMHYHQQQQQQQQRRERVRVRTGTGTAEVVGSGDRNDDNASIASLNSRAPTPLMSNAASSRIMASSKSTGGLVLTAKSPSHTGPALSIPTGDQRYARSAIITGTAASSSSASPARIAKRLWRSQQQQHGRALSEVTSSHNVNHTNYNYHARSEVQLWAQAPTTATTTTHLQAATILAGNTFKKILSRQQQDGNDEGRRQHYQSLTQSHPACPNGSDATHSNLHQQQQSQSQPTAFTSAASFARDAPMAGYLQKLGQHIPEFKRRFFVLKPTTYLYYFISPHDEEPRGCIDLDYYYSPATATATTTSHGSNKADCFKIEFLKDEYQHSDGTCRFEIIIGGTDNDDHRHDTCQTATSSVEDSDKVSSSSPISSSVHNDNHHGASVPLQQPQSSKAASTPTRRIVLEARTRAIAEEWIQSIKQQRLSYVQSQNKDLFTQNTQYGQTIQQLQQQLDSYKLMELDYDGAIFDVQEWKLKFQNLNQGIGVLTRFLLLQKTHCKNINQKNDNNNDNCEAAGEKEKEEEVEKTNVEETINPEEEEQQQQLLNKLNLTNTIFSSLSNACHMIKENLALSIQEASCSIEEIHKANERCKEYQDKLEKSQSIITKLWEANCNLQKSVRMMKKEKRVLVKEVKYLMSNPPIPPNHHHPSLHVTKKEDKNVEQVDVDFDKDNTINIANTYSNAYPLPPWAPNNARPYSVCGVSTTMSSSLLNMNTNNDNHGSSHNVDEEENFLPTSETYNDENLIRQCKQGKSRARSSSPLQPRILLLDNLDRDGDESISTDVSSSRAPSICAGVPHLIDDQEPRQKHCGPLLDNCGVSTHTQHHRRCPSTASTLSSQVTITENGRATSSLGCPILDSTNTRYDNHDSDCNMPGDNGEVYHLTFYTQKIGIQFQKVPVATTPIQCDNKLSEAIFTDDLHSSSQHRSMSIVTRTNMELKRVAGITKGVMGSLSSGTTPENRRGGKIGIRAYKDNDVDNETVLLQQMQQDSCPVAKPIDAVLVCGFHGFDEGRNSHQQRPQIGARLVAFDGIPLEIGQWTFDKVRRAIQARGRPMVLSFRNDALNLEQRAILYKAVAEVIEADQEGYAKFQNSSVAIKADTDHRNSVVGNYGREFAKETSASAGAASPLLSWIHNTKKAKTQESYENNRHSGSHQEVNNQNCNDSDTENVLPLNSANLERLNKNNNIRVSTPSSIDNYEHHYHETRGNPQHKKNYRSFSDVGGASSIISSAVTPLVANLLSGLARGETRSEHFPPSYLRDDSRSCVDTISNHIDFKAGLL